MQQFCQSWAVDLLMVCACIWAIVLCNTDKCRGQKSLCQGPLSLIEERQKIENRKVTKTSDTSARGRTGIGPIAEIR